MTERVFVYGTLMKGEKRHGMLENSTFLGKARARGLVMRSLGAYPMAFYGAGLVYGELYEVSAGVMVALDMIEAPAGYSRVKRTIQCEREQVVEAWVYVGVGKERGKVVKGGRWRG